MVLNHSSSLTNAPSDDNHDRSRWDAFVSKVHEFRGARKLCLMPIVLAGYPTREASFEYVQILSSAGIDLIEVVDPIPSGFAATTNERIQRAHLTALPHAAESDGPLLAKGFTGSLKVLYRGNVKTTLNDLIRENGRVYSILQLALPPGDNADLAGSERLPPTTTLVSAFDDLAVITKSVESARWMLVCKIASSTGGQLIEWQRIRDVLAHIRAISELPLFCTFGVSSPATVSRLREHLLCDGVIVGTALLERLEIGLSKTEAFVTTLQHAAAH